MIWEYAFRIRSDPSPPQFRLLRSLRSSGLPLLDLPLRYPSRKRRCAQSIHSLAIVSDAPRGKLFAAERETLAGRLDRYLASLNRAKKFGFPPHNPSLPERYRDLRHRRGDAVDFRPTFNPFYVLRAPSFLGLPPVPFGTPLDKESLRPSWLIVYGRGCFVLGNR